MKVGREEEAVMGGDGEKNQSENRLENLFISPKWSAQMVHDHRAPQVFLFGFGFGFGP